MSDETYECAKDIEQSGVRFVSTEPGDAAIDFNCERICYAIESLCNGRKIVDLPPEDDDDDDDEPQDRLDPLFNSDDFPQPFLDLLYANTTDIFTSNNIAIIEFIFNCSFSILFENVNTLNSNIDQISTMLSTQTDEYNKLNIKLLCLLFNLIPRENELRVVVMQRLLSIGARIKSTLAQQIFAGRLHTLSTWIEKDWNKYLNLSDKKRFYQTASVVAKKAAEKETYLKYLICYLKLFDLDENEQIDEKQDYLSVVDEAAQAIIAAISSTEFNMQHVMQLIHTDIICKVMRKTPKYAELYALLEIVYQGEVKDFEQFYAQNTEKMVELGLIYTHLQKKMRLLTLCTLGANGLLYSFDELMVRLQLDSQNELEELVILAITKKLLSAKIDYSTQCIEITKVKQRTFNKNSWMDLSKRLSLWRQNTNTVLQIIHNAGLNRWRQQYMQEMAKQAQNQ